MNATVYVTEIATEQTRPYDTSAQNQRIVEQNIRAVLALYLRYEAVDAALASLIDGEAVLVNGWVRISL